MISSRSFRDVSIFSISEAYLKLTRFMIPGNCRLSSKSFVGDPRQIVDTFDYKESLTRSVTHLTGINLNHRIQDLQHYYGIEEVFSPRG